MVGTRYSNEGNEGRVTLTHAPVGNWTGVWGMQFADTVFSAIGEEAFVPQIRPQLHRSFRGRAL